MPELPEVEHVVRALRPIVTGRRILAAELNLKRIAPELSRAAFGRQLRNTLITGVGRRGKYILFELESGRMLTTHLRMTGKFVSLTTDESLPPYAHVVFYLDDERRLVFCDMRQFGRMRLISSAAALAQRTHARSHPNRFPTSSLKNIFSRHWRVRSAASNSCCWTRRACWDSEISTRSRRCFSRV